MRTGISQQKWHWYHQARSLMDLDRLDSASRGPLGSAMLLIRPIRQLVFPWHLTKWGLTNCIPGS